MVSTQVITQEAPRLDTLLRLTLTLTPTCCLPQLSLGQSLGGVQGLRREPALEKKLALAGREGWNLQFQREANRRKLCLNIITYLHPQGTTVQKLGSELALLHYLLLHSIQALLSIFASCPTRILCGPQTKKITVTLVIT